MMYIINFHVSSPLKRFLESLNSNNLPRQRFLSIKNRSYEAFVLFYTSLVLAGTVSVKAQTPGSYGLCGDFQAEYNPETSAAASTLCENFGGIEFDLVIGQGASSGIVNSQQLSAVLPPNPKLLVVGDFSVINELELENAIVKILPNIAINIDAGISPQLGGGSLILNNCKLFACAGMWKGIVVKSTFTRITSINYTQIEDAENAMQINNVNSVLLEVSNTIFNRNKNGIVIESGTLLPHSVFFSVFANNKFDCTNPLNGTINEITEVGVRLKNIALPFIDNNQNGFNQFKNIKTGIIAEGDVIDVVVKNSLFDNISENAIFFKGKKLTVSGSTFTRIGQFGVHFMNSLELSL